LGECWSWGIDEVGGTGNDIISYSSTVLAVKGHPRLHLYALRMRSQEYAHSYSHPQEQKHHVSLNLNLNIFFQYK
jgi:hypothetical protein